ncbi:hypothetical protein ACFX15_012119 [Malus domestica]
MLTSTLFIGVLIGLRNLSEMNDVGVQAVDDLASLDEGRGDLYLDGVCISGVDTPCEVVRMGIHFVSSLLYLRRGHPV